MAVQVTFPRTSRPAPGGAGSLPRGAVTLRREGAWGAERAQQEAVALVDLRLRILDTLRLLYQGFERASLAFTKARGGQPSCVEACGLCCQHNTPAVTEPEAAYILAHLPSMSQPLQNRLWAALERWLTDPAPPGPDPGSRADAMLAQSCPFLGTKEEGFPCLIHEVRPLSCRAYSVTMGPQMFCQRPKVWYENETRWGALVDGPLVDALRQGVRVFYKLIRKSPAGMRSGFLPWYVARLWRPDRVKTLPVTPERTLEQPEPAALLFEEQAPSGWRLGSLSLADARAAGLFETAAPGTPDAAPLPLAADAGQTRKR